MAAFGALSNDSSASAIQLLKEETLGAIAWHFLESIKAKNLKKALECF